MRTLQRVTSSDVRQWEDLRRKLNPGQGYLVENHGKVEAVILHPDDWAREHAAFDLKAHFAAVRASRPLPPASIGRASEL